MGGRQRKAEVLEQQWHGMSPLGLAGLEQPVGLGFVPTSTSAGLNNRRAPRRPHYSLRPLALLLLATSLLHLAEV